ncbi:unnamed protein product [Coregonus sp. 'balchen']|nr:unnamed protein product [Coregonus sp. 'balchen']
MALASGHWVAKETKGEPPSPRHGHALAVAGNIAFLFGGVSTISHEEDQPVYLNDFYMLTVSATHITWEVMPQNGVVPPAREGHTLCVVKGKLYLFGGVASPQAGECLPGVYCFDIVSLTWERLAKGGVSLRTIRHSSFAVGDNIYVYGGHQDGVPTDDLMMFNTASLNWTPVKTTGTLPSARYNQTFAVVSEQVFMFGGCAEDGCYYRDIHVLNTESLVWQRYGVKGESPLACAGQTLTAHHDKDIYLFGGKCTSQDGTVTSTNEIHKLSIAKMKWKVPLYVGIPPARRHDHTAFILHSHVPNVKYELSESPSLFSVRTDAAASAQVTAQRDFSAVRDEAMDMIHKAFSMLDGEFQKLDRERSELAQSAAALQYKREAHEAHHQQQEEELRQMLERHRAQNETWLRARAEENDKERKGLCKLRGRLKEEQGNIQKRSEHLLSIMQQFKGM